MFAASIEDTVYSFCRFVIPEDTFSDLEDGNTRNLRLIFKTEEGTSVASTSWLQFNPEKQEFYGL
jgi:neurexin